MYNSWTKPLTFGFDRYNHIVRSLLFGFIIADKVPNIKDRDREAHAVAGTSCYGVRLSYADFLLFLQPSFMIVSLQHTAGSYVCTTMLLPTVESDGVLLSQQSDFRSAIHRTATS